MLGVEIGGIEMGDPKKITRSVMIVAVFAGLALLASAGLAERPKAAAGICGALSDARPRAI
jgi:hypothetical protein